MVQSERESYARCRDVLKVTGLSNRATAHTRLQRKRCKMARALAIEPKLPLLDEIAGGLTEYECGELVKTIKDVQRRRGTTIVWIEHIVHVIWIRSRLIVMEIR